MATIKQRGESWQLNWSQGGKQYRISLGKISPREADIKRREKELELRTGRRYSTSNLTFAAFALEYLQWFKVQFPRSYDRTAIIVEHYLVPEFGPRDIDTITPLDVTGYISRRAAAQSTITREVRCLLAMLNRAKEWRLIREHMLETYSPPQERSSKAPLYYSALELKRLYWASYDYEDTWRLYANTGMRRNEGLYLKLKDCKANSILVESREESPTKSKKWREIPLNEPAKAAVEALKERATGPYLLPRVRPESLSRAFDTCAIRVALPGSLHTLRHTFVSHLVMAGVDLPTVQKLAGHASITTTMRYAHLAEEHKAAAVMKIAI